MGLHPAHSAGKPEKGRLAPGKQPGSEEERPMAMLGDFHARDHAWQPPALTPAYKTSIARSPAQPLLSVPQTPSEITGPTFGQSDLGLLDGDLLQNYSHGGDPIGERIIVHGRVTDGNGRPVPGALVEIWQANAGGRYRHVTDTYLAAIDPNFGGCGRCLTDADGAYAFRTIKCFPHHQARRLSVA
jgi:protocatechuate 3,4-dioxygenase beta subunit